MALFGDKARFALECSPIAESDQRLPQCNFTYWISNREIGNYHFEATIEDLIEELRGMITCSGRRSNSDLFGMPANSAVKMIFDGLCGNSSDDVEWGAYDLTYLMGHGYPIGVGHRYNVFLVENTGLARILVADIEVGMESNFSIDIILDCIFEEGEVDSILIGAWKCMIEIK